MEHSHPASALQRGQGSSWTFGKEQPVASTGELLAREPPRAQLEQFEQ
jgi:hypothetical protein